MRWRICNGLVPREAIDAYIQKAAYQQTEDGEQNRQAYFHGCLLWTYDRSEVNSSFVPLLGAGRDYGVGIFLSSLRVPIHRDEAISLWKKDCALLSTLPAQEGIGHPIDDIPDT
jgi:hypothetical protein